MKATPPQLVIMGHSDSITSLAFSADGNTLVSGGYDETAIVWDVSTGTMRRLLTLRDSINALALTPDGRILVTEGGQVWDVLTGQVVHTFRNLCGPLACSPDGTMLASNTFGSDPDDCIVLLSCLRTGRNKGRLACGGFQPKALAFSLDGQRLGVADVERHEDGTYSGFVTIYEVRTGKTYRTLHDQNISALFTVNSPSGPRLAAVTSGGKQVWDAQTEELLYTVEREEFSRSLGDVFSLCLSPDGCLIAIGTAMGWLMVYEAPTSRRLWQIRAHQGWPRALAFTSDSCILASAGDDHAIRLWDARTGEPFRTLAGTGPSVEAVAFTSDGKGITALYSDDSARLWRLDEVRLARQETEPFGALNLGAPKLPDTARHLWDLSLAVLPERIEGYFAMNIAAISPDGSLVVWRDFKSGRPSLQIWNVKSRRVQSTMEDTCDPWGALAISPDNRFLATGSTDDLIRLYDVATGSIGKELTYSKEEMGWLMTLMFSADGRTLASGHPDALVLWDVNSGKSIRVWPTFGEGVCALAFSPDGKSLADATHHSKVAYVQRLKQGGKQAALRGHTDDVRTVTYSPDGTRLATGAQDGSVRLWEAIGGKLLLTCLPLPAGEWILYTPQGYYTGSPDAERYLLWREGADLPPADAFVGRFRNPETIKSQLRG